MATKPQCPEAMMASSSPPDDLVLLLERVVTTLPPETHTLVLRHLPAVELARLSCVHKAYLVAWRRLQEQVPGRRYALPLAVRLSRAEWGALQGVQLARAAAFGDVAVIRSMFAAGVDEHGTPLLLARDSLNNMLTVDSAALAAVGGGHSDALELLIEHGAGVRADDDSLRVAVFYGHAGMVQLLIQHGADVHADGDYALKAACMCGHTGLVELLIQHGADVHSGGDEPLRFASAFGHPGAVAVLLQHGADVHAHGDEALTEASKCSDALQMFSRRIGKAAAAVMQTDISQAFQVEENGHDAVIQLLVQHGADVHASDDLVLRRASVLDRADLVQFLLQHGADVHADDDGALRLTSIVGHVDVVRLLLQHGADVHAHDDEALRTASLCGRAGTVALLLQNGANVHAKDGEALISASGNAKGPGPDQMLLMSQEVSSDLPFPPVSKQETAEVLQLLLQHGADVHADGDYALRLASANGHVDVVRLLIQHGADANVNGGAAYHLASFNGHVDVMRLLEQHGAHTGRRLRRRR
jgi:ankyrin repeat protein